MIWSIKLLKKNDELTTINDELDIYLEIPHIAYAEVKKKDGGKALLFTNVVDKKSGAKFDAWKECFNLELWENALLSNSLDSDFYISRNRGKDEVLPWDHLNIGVSKEFLLHEYILSSSKLISVDCRNGCLSCGIQSTFQINCSELRTGESNL